MSEPRTVTLSDGTHWEFRSTQGIFVNEDGDMYPALTAEDHRAMADVLDPAPLASPGAGTGEPWENLVDTVKGSLINLRRSACDEKLRNVIVLDLEDALAALRAAPPAGPELRRSALIQCIARVLDALPEAQDEIPDDAETLIADAVLALYQSAPPAGGEPSACGCQEHRTAKECKAGCRCECNADYVRVDRWECQIGCGLPITAEEIATHDCQKIPASLASRLAFTSPPSAPGAADTARLDWLESFADEVNSAAITLTRYGIGRTTFSANREAIDAARDAARSAPTTEGQP